MFILYAEYIGNYFDGVDEDKERWRNGGMAKLLWESRELGDIVE